jgi:hypothetical protein
MVLGRTVGLGGRDVTHYDVMYMAEEGLKAARQGHPDQQAAWHFDVVEDENMLGRLLQG